MLYDFGTDALYETESVALKTERLVLRAPVPADGKAIARLANDRRIAENLRRLPHPYSRADAEAFLDYLARASQETAFLIEADGTPCGMIGLDFGNEEGPEIGYWLGVAHWGNGFATEGAKAALEYAFSVLNLQHVISLIHPHNAASIRVALRIGEKPEGQAELFGAMRSVYGIDRP